MRSKRVFSVLLALLSVLLLFTVSASALTWDGSSAGGSTSAVNGSSTGYVIRSTKDDYCVVGYRFSVVNSAGNLKVNKVIDVYRNTTNGDNAYSTSAKFSTKYNKKQLIANKNATLTTTYNTTNCYKEKDMGFVSKLPNPSGVETWQKYETNINKVLTKIGVGTTANMVYGDKVIIEPLFDVCLAGEYQALTVTEIAYCGRSVKGGSSDGGTSNGTSSTWGFIANYTNRIWPNKLYTPNGQGLWSAASALSSKTTFDNIMTKGYGAGIAYNETTKIEYTIKFDGNGATSGSTASMSMIYGTAKNLTANGFKRTGYKFTGWNTKANGSGTKYSDKQSVNNLSSTNGATVTLYAQWTPNVLTVMYDCFGSSVTIDKSKGYFLGDYNRLCSTTERNKELWGTKNVYYATYKYNDAIGGNGLHDFSTFGLKAPTGYKFAGWGCNGKTFDEKTTTYKPTDFTNDIKTGDAEVWLSAKISPISYTITHDPNGGGWGSDKAKDTRNYTIAGNVNILVAPTRSGYTFNGWKVTSAGGNWTANKVYTVSGSALSLTGMYGNVTLTAQWSENKHTLKTTFYYMTASGTATSTERSSTVNVSTTSVAVTAPTPAGTVTKSGRTYTFSHWSTTNSASGAKTTSYTAATDKHNYYAVYTSPVKITYNGNGNTGGSTAATSGTNKYNYNASSSTGVSLTTASNGFTKTGYTYRYWTVEKDADAGYAVGTKLTLYNDMLLYAKWQPISYSVKFNGNGSTSGSMSNESFTYDTAKALTTNAFKRAFTVTYNYNGNGQSNSTATANATFNGWATSASGSKVYNDKQSVNNLTSTAGATVNLYAKWTDASVTLPTPTRTGYTLKGWYTAASSGTKVGDGGASYKPSASVTLYAQWTPITYSVKFNGNGSTSGSMSNQSHTYDTAKALTANAFKRAFTVTYNYNGNGKSNTTATANATFSGWATSASGAKVYSDKQSVKNLTSTAGATVNLYAKWTDASVTLPTPTRTGYTFGGWYTAASGGTKIGAGGASYKPTANITLYAHWSPISYSVKFNGNGSTSGSMSNQSFTYDVAQNLTANAFKRAFVVTYNYNGNGSKDSSVTANAAFSGWATSASGAKVYSDKQSVKNLTSTAGATVNLYAKWTDASVTLPTPTRTGYTFSGWFTAATGGTKIGAGGAKYTPNKNITLYAQWTPITYSVKFNGNGSTSGSMSNQSFTYDVAKALTANAFKRAFTVTYNYNGNGKANTTATANAAFGGWATSASGQKAYNDKQSVKNLTTTAGATVNLYAKWTDASVTLPTPTRTGYIFNGWFTAASGGTKVGAGGATYTPSKNITLYAHWSPITYTIKFAGNGSTSGAMANMFMTYDVAKNLTDNAFKRTGYSFTGWNTKADGGGTKYTNKQSVKNLTTTNGATITLYAQWTPDSYTIKFNGNTATSGSMSDLKMTYDVAKNLTANAFKKTGYTFKNWNTKADGTGTSYADKQSVKNLPVSSGNTITLYAQWTPISYTIKFNGNGSTSGTMANLAMTYDVAKNLTANAFKKTGYVFSGWATTATGKATYSDKQSVKNLTTTNGATINLYAVWTPITYTIKFNGNNSTSGSMSNLTMTYDTAKALTSNAFKRTGYTFGGWNTAADGSGTKYTDKQNVKNLTITQGATVNLYAQWSPISYAVKFNGNGSTSGSMSNQSFVYDKAQNLTANAFKREFTITYNYNYSGSTNATTKASATFNGWAASASGAVAYTNKQSVKNLSSTSGAVVNLYAKWTDKAVTLPTPTRTGYVFDGWYTSASSGTKIGSGGGSYTPNKDITVYAHWSPITYTIKFNGNGSSSGSMSNLSMTYDTAKSLTANAFKRTGYTYVDWNTKADGTGTAYSDKQSVKNLTTTNGATINLYAQWTPIGYSVKFNGNGSTSGSMANQSFIYDIAQNLTANAFKREFTITYNYNYAGKTNTTAKATAAFNGWATSSTDSVVYADKQSVKNLSSNAGAVINVYAKWSDAKATLPTPTRTGYIFDGWYTTATGGTKIGGGGSSYTTDKDITVYAHWTPITYTIKFDGNKATSGTMSNLAMTYDVAKNLTANAYVRTGYTFSGWNTSADGKGTAYADKQSVKNLTATDKATITLYAQWKPISYTIRFNGNGAGSGSMSDLAMIYDVEKTLTANAFVKNAAEFVKWNTKADGTGTDYADKQVVKNLTTENRKVIVLYAQWKNVRELSLEAVTPNAAYRESTDVITSFNLVNKGEGVCLPTDNVSVVFKVYKDSTVIKTVTQTNVVVPGNERNLLFFKWTVPTNLGSSKIYVSAEIVENNSSYGLIKNQYATCKYNVYATPDTQYEASAPDGFTVPGTPTAKSDTAKWSVWTYENNAFKKLNYGMSISDAAATITPDESANAEQQGGVWVMKSGYGYGISLNNGVKTLSGYTAAPTAAYTNAQYALALFPEFGYAQTSNNCRTLELVSGKWNFRENSDYGRIHFTPLWYPDGNYTAAVLQSDCWTPAGMISRMSDTNTITISGSAYDDWFIS